MLHALLTLVHALVVTTIVDYCSSVLSGFPDNCFNGCSLVFIAAARLVFSAKKSEHITTLAESSGDNSVPVMCSRLSLPYRQGAVIHC